MNLRKITKKLKKKVDSNKIKFLEIITIILSVILLLTCAFGLFSAIKLEREGASLSRWQKKVIKEEVISSKELLLIKKSNPGKYREISKYLNGYCYLINERFEMSANKLYVLSFICIMIAIMNINNYRLKKKNIFLEYESKKNRAAQILKCDENGQ